MQEIIVPNITANEDVVMMVDICKNNEHCKKGDIIAVLESTKTAFEIEAENDGYIYFVVSKGAEVATGQIIAYMSKKRVDIASIEREKKKGSNKKVDTEEQKLNITNKAQKLLQEYGLNAYDIKDSGILRQADVRMFLGKVNKLEEPQDAIIDEYRKLEEIFKSNDSSGIAIEDVEKLKKTLSYAFNLYSKRWNRKIPFTDVFFDRWTGGKINDFGENSNVSHLSFIFGDVKVGRNTFIGPFTYIDGSGGLQIGDNCSIAVGVQIYSHDTIARALSGHRSQRVTAPTKIGNNCFIGPNAVIAKGVTIGNSCFIGANSLITSDVHDNSVMMGVPAKRFGKVVVLADGQVSIVKDRCE